MSIKWTTQKKMEKLLEMDMFPRLKQEEIENTERPVTGSETLKTKNKKQAKDQWFKWRQGEFPLRLSG